jgi:hypothetical protein
MALVQHFDRKIALGGQLDSCYNLSPWNVHEEEEVVSVFGSSHKV